MPYTEKLNLAASDASELMERDDTAREADSRLLRLKLDILNRLARPIGAPVTIIRGGRRILGVVSARHMDAFGIVEYDIRRRQTRGPLVKIQASDVVVFE